MVEKFVVTGRKTLHGKVKVSGSKNVALKVLVAACLTDEEVIIENVPHISDVFSMIDIMKDLGAHVVLEEHKIHIRMQEFATHEITLEKAAKLRASVMFIAPLLARIGEAIIPNPGGCRLGARPIDRIIEGLHHMNADILYKSDDGYFHAKTTGFQGTSYIFKKNTHTGTETLILASVLAKGTTVLKNAAEEPEIDDLIDLLNQMGAEVKRTGVKEITIHGVSTLHGAVFTISPDRNEIVTLAIAAIVTKGDILIEGATKNGISEFLSELEKAGGGYEETAEGMRFYYNGELQSTDIVTSIYPGFMTDWQAPWSVLMTQANGISIIHEAVFENKLGHIEELKKMGAVIEPFDPEVKDKEAFYNFNLEDDDLTYIHAVKISGPTPLHNAILKMENIRAGATMVLAALAAKGTTTIFGIEKLDRGYEVLEERLRSLGAEIERVKEV